MIKTYVVTWKNVVGGIDAITSQIDNCVVINSDAPERDEWRNLGLIWYYNQMKYAIDDFIQSEDDIFCWITGDVSSNNFREIHDKAYSVMTTEEDVFIYAPNFTYEAWGRHSCSIKERDKYTYYACQTDGIMLFMKRELVELLSKYMDNLSKRVNLHEMRSGWGLDYVWSTLAIYMDKRIVRDTEFIVTHPQGSSYDHGKASGEMNQIRDIFFDFAKNREMNLLEIQSIWGKIAGRMGHDPSCMQYKDFYPNKHSLKYMIMSINNTRIENKEQIKTVLGSKNFVDMKFLDASNKDELEYFMRKNPDVVPKHNYKVGEVGCFGSHYLIWKYLSKYNLENIIVFEDDAIVDEDFVERVEGFIQHLPIDYDIFSIYVDQNQYDRYNKSEHYVNNDIAKGYQDWSTLCYMVSKKGAEKLLNRVATHGMDAPADWFIFRNGHNGIFDVYTLPPSIKVPVKINDITGSMVQHTNFIDGTENK